MGKKATVIGDHELRLHQRCKRRVNGVGRLSVAAAKNPGVCRTVVAEFEQSRRQATEPMARTDGAGPGIDHQQFVPAKPEDLKTRAVIDLSLPGGDPFPGGATQRPAVFERLAAIDVITIEEERQPGQSRLSERIDMMIGRPRPDIRQAEFARIAPMRAETLQSDPGAPELWRLEVGVKRQLLGQPRIFSGILIRESVQEVPVDTDPQLSAPAEQLKILDPAGALAHGLEHRAAEALYPRLNPGDPSGTHRLQIGPREIRPDLKVERQRRSFRGEHRKQRLRIPRIHRIIDALDGNEGVGGGQGVEFAQHSGGRLATIGEQCG